MIAAAADSSALALGDALTHGRVERNADARLVGRTVPGVPEAAGEIEGWQYVGAYEADALNTVWPGGYGVFGAGLDYSRNGSPPRDGRLGNRWATALRARRAMFHTRGHSVHLLR